MKKLKSDFFSVGLLIRAGARADQHNEDLGLSPIHVATAENSITGVRLLLETPANKASVNSMMRNGRTPLHLASEKGNTEMMQLLLDQPDLDNVDAEDLMGRQTPSFLAAKNGKLAAVKLLLEYGASLDNTVENKSLEDYLSEKFPQLRPRSVAVRVKPRESSEQDVLYSASKLLDKAQMAVVKGNSNAQNLVFFKTLVQNIAATNKSLLDSFNSGGMTLLQKACDYGVAEFAQVLLEWGVSANDTTNETPTQPILLAAYSGHSHVLQALLLHKKESDDVSKAARLDVQDSFSRESILHYILKMPKKMESPTKVSDYKDCLNLLFDTPSKTVEKELEKIINKRDLEGNSALHCATQSWSQDVVRKLLEKGANIGLKNNWDETPISKIKPETMENFLDEFCLNSKNDIHQEDFELEFNYAFIAPPVDNPRYDERDPEGQQYIASQAWPETETLWYMAQSRDHRHLLKHPVITSFLWMKWHRIRKPFNRNLRLYLLFVISLIWYIFERFGGNTTDTLDGVSYCSTSRLGEDPRIGFWYSAFLVQALLQFILIFRDWRRDLKESNCKVALQVFFTSWLEYLILVILIVLLTFQSAAMTICLTILLCLVLSREALQMMVSLKRYVFGLENWLELATLALTAVILYVPDEKFSSPCDTKRNLAAFTIVLSCATLITLIGRHPKLAQYNIYVTMFYKILSTFATFLLWYSAFLIAFSLGFYIMLHKESPAGGGDYVFFDDPWLSFVKTCTMFVGEIEFSDIPIDLENGLWPLGYIFLLGFIFLIGKVTFIEGSLTN